MVRSMASAKSGLLLILILAAAFLIAVTSGAEATKVEEKLLIKSSSARKLMASLLGGLGIASRSKTGNVVGEVVVDVSSEAGALGGGSGLNASAGITGAANPATGSGLNAGGGVTISTNGLVDGILGGGAAAAAAKPAKP